MIWFPIIPLYHHSDDYSGGLSCEFREEEKRINKRIKLVGTIFEIVGLALEFLIILALLVRWQL